MGFKSDDQSSDKLEKNKSETLRLAEPEDLLGFGLIPEFIGRLPIISTLDELSEEQLIRILTEPKNAILKQYQKLIALEGAELNLTKDALQGLAQGAVKRGTGARALRSIFEKLMLDIMYELPSNKDIKKISINRSVVDGKKSPVLRKKANKDAA
jgi:ATP-dependent Clp protease ATP-binding subunit ClpX